MCHKEMCEKCHKPTWVGCGKHVEYALSGVPEEERCHCKPWTQAMVDADPNYQSSSCTTF